MIFFKRRNVRRVWHRRLLRLAWFIAMVALSACQGSSHSESRYMLTVNPYGEGMGSVSIEGGGIDCVASCSETFDEGRMIVLVATPGENSSFGGWSGGGCSGTGDCRITLKKTVMVSAYFTVAEEKESTAKHRLAWGRLGISNSEILPGIKD